MQPGSGTSEAKGCGESVPYREKRNQAVSPVTVHESSIRYNREFRNHFMGRDYTGVGELTGGG
jgi:hypothetical protein